MSGFCHVSMLIDLDFEPWPATPAAYTNTAGYFPRRSRTLVHESIHYWQQLSQSYLLLLAAEDWERMTEWERAGGQPSPGPRRSHFYEPEGRHGFSAYQLSECFARFWEVLRVGPAQVLKDATREGALSDRTFDLAMAAAGAYGLPYAVSRRVLDPQIGLVIFPFLVHFALQTSRPAHYFECFLDEAVPAASGVAEALRAGARALYPVVEQKCAEIAARQGGPGLRHAADLFRISTLRGNYVYRWSFGRLRQVVGFERAVALFGLHFDWLAMSATPPCIRFRDRQAIGLSHAYLEAAGEASIQELRRARTAHHASLGLQQRWERFQETLRNPPPC